MYRIVVISNDDSFLRDAEKFLPKSINDVRVITTSDPAEINDILKREEVDIYVCDHNPDFDAFRVFDKRCAAQDYRPFIITAKEFDEKTLLKAFESGIGYCYPRKFVPAVDFLGMSKKIIVLVEKYRIQVDNKVNDRRLRALVKLSRMYNRSFKEIMHYALEESIVLTNSDVGYVALYNKDKDELEMQTWSQRTMAQSTMPERPMKFSLPKTGLWGEPIRLKQGIIVNNYDIPHPGKKGTPEGHIKLNRLILIPMMYKGEIVGTAGVANKTTDYNDADMNQFILMMDGFISIYVEKKSNEEKIATEHRLRNVIMSAPMGILIMDDTLRVYDYNEYADDLLKIGNASIINTEMSSFAAKVIDALSKMDIMKETARSDSIISDDKEPDKKYRVTITLSHDNNKRPFYFIMMEDYSDIAVMSDIIEKKLFKGKVFDEIMNRKMQLILNSATVKLMDVPDPKVRQEIRNDLADMDRSNYLYRVFRDIGVMDREWQNMGKIVHSVSRKFDGRCSISSKIDSINVLADMTLGKMFTIIVSIAHTCGANEVDMSYRIHRGNLTMIVEGNGIGLSDAFKKALTDDDANIDSVSLFIVHTIADASNFTICENGDPQEGVRFEIGVSVNDYEIE